MGAISHELLCAEFPAPLAQIQERLRREGSSEGELKHRSKAGREIFVSSHWVLHRDEVGEALAVIEVTTTSRSGKP